MAEFCLDCLNRLEGTCYTKWDVSLSWSKDICEGCSQLRRTVICLRKRTIRRQYLGLYDDNHRKSRKQTHIDFPLKTAIMKIEKEHSRLTVTLSRFSQKKLTAYL